MNTSPVDESKQFCLQDGRCVRNIVELAQVMPDVSEDIFNHHVNDTKNDFANWIENVFSEKDLASSLRKLNTRKQTTDLLKRFAEKGHFVYETIILGAGIAGIAASIYAARKRMDYLLISTDLGGQMAISGDIENYPGFTKISSEEYRKRMKEQLEFNKVDVIYETVEKIEKVKDGHFNVKTKERNYHTETIILATGARPRTLNVPGEKELSNRGLSYCAICDGPLFKDKVVAVVGGGDAALESAEFLMRIAKKIYLITMNDKMMGHEYLLERVVGQEKVEIIPNASTTKILGDKMVNGLTYKQDGKEHTLDIEGMFIEIGRIPNTEILSGLVELDDHKHIKVNQFMETSVEGIYAAGDCADIHEYQYIISGGQGVTALLRAAKQIARNEKK